MKDDVRRGDADAAASGRAMLTSWRGYGRDFWLVFAATFALNLVSNLFVFFPVFIVKLGGDAAVIGAIASLGALAALTVRPALGALIDRLGRRRIALWSLLIEATAMGLYAPVRSLHWPIYAVRMLHGVGEGTARVALFAMVYEILPRRRRGEGMMLFSICGIGAAAVGPLIAEAMLKRFGFTVFFCAASGLCLIAATGAALLVDDRPRKITGAAAPSGERTGYRALLLNANLLPLWVVALAFSIAIASRINFVAPFAYQHGITHVAWYFAAYSAIAVIVRLSGGRMLERVGIERMLAPSLGLLAVGVGLLALTGKSGALASAAIAGGLGHAYTYPALSALVITHTPAQAVGRSSAIYTSLFDVATMIAPYLLGLIATLWGYAPMFVVAGLVAASGAAFFAAANNPGEALPVDGSDAVSANLSSNGQSHVDTGEGER